MKRIDILKEMLLKGYKLSMEQKFVIYQYIIQLEKGIENDRY